MINIILIILSGIFVFSAVYNMRLKKDIIIPGIMDKIITVSLILSLGLFILVAYMLDANMFGYLAAITGWFSLYSLMTCTGFTKDYIIYFGGLSLLLSKKKIQELKYIKVNYIYKSGIVKTTIRGNLLKRTMYFQNKYLKTIEKALKKNKVRLYKRDENVKEDI